MRDSPDEICLPWLFPDVVCLNVTADKLWTTSLLPEEAYIARNMGNTRRREFAAGRAAAHASLQKLGAPLEALLVAENCEPLWPCGYVGSISHCEGFCGAAVARICDVSGIGFDVESTSDLPVNLEEIVLSRGECDRFRKLIKIEGVDLRKLAFSAKEAFIKCHSSLVTAGLNFRDFSVDFATEGPRWGAFHISLGKLNDATPIARDNAVGRWFIANERIFTSFVRGI